MMLNWCMQMRVQMYLIDKHPVTCHAFGHVRLSVVFSVVPSLILPAALHRHDDGLKILLITMAGNM